MWNLKICLCLDPFVGFDNSRETADDNSRENTNRDIAMFQDFSQSSRCPVDENVAGFSSAYGLVSYT